MMTNGNMFSPFMCTWIFENINSIFIVIINMNAFRVNTKVFEVLPYPQQEAAATYSASAVDMVTECCFLVAQDTKQGPRK